MQREKLFRILKYILTIAAGINLILLFVFHYELPSFIQHKLNKKQEEELTSETIQAKDNLTIHFDSDELIYSGKGDLNLTGGVSVTKGNNIEVKADLYSEIKASDSGSKKIITYTAKDAYGNTGTADRTLILKKYKGPSIKIEKDYPTIDDTELDSITDIFKDSKTVTAYDGYSNVITDSLETIYTITNASATKIKIGFQVTNLFGDTASKIIETKLERTGPLLTLTKEEDHLALGTTFNPVHYIASATDKQGTDISTKVTTEGEINTDQPGTYVLTYKLTDQDGNEAIPRTLKIIVN